MTRSSSTTSRLDPTTVATTPVALLTGGKATRLGSVAADVPKALVEVAGRPFIDHQLDLLRRSGFRRIVLCTGHLADRLESHIGDGSRFGLSVVFSHDGPRPLGTGGAVRKAAPLLGETFWIMYGDSYMEMDYAAALTEFLDRDAVAMMTVLRNENRWDRSNVLFRDGRLLRYDKRNPTPDMRHIDYGVALMRRTALDAAPTDKAFDLADLYSRLVSEGRMAGFEVSRRFYEIGTPAALEETRRYLERRD